MKSGFTLIELLIVIAVLGTLMAIIVVALNPAQILARGRDGGRKSTVTQLGGTLNTYSVGNNGLFVPEAGCGNPAGWINCLVTAGEVSVVPAAVSYPGTIQACGVNAQNGYCYDTTNNTTGGPVVVFARLEANADNSRCVADNAATPDAYAVYSTADGRGGVVCRAANTPPVAGNQTFLP